MKKINQKSLIALALILTISLSSCEAIAGVFKAGMWFGVIGIILIVALIFWLVNKARK
ncbi:MAG: hypothetical protein ABIR19_08685 [Ginsengibacter sp.]